MATTFDPNYSTNLPSPQEIKDHYNELIEYWGERNKHIAKVRTYLNGKNTVKFPEEAPFVPRVARTFMLRSISNEKQARFMLQPRIQVVPEDVGDRARKRSTDMEEALNTGMYWMEVHGDGDTWTKVKADCIDLGAGVERIDCAPAAFWPELTSVEYEGKRRERLSVSRPFESPEKYIEYRERYKKDAGFPIRSVYVPLENCFPDYNGSIPEEVFQREQRSLRSVMANPLFSDIGLNALRQKAGGLTSAQLFKQQVTIIHYVNQMWHAYYALTPLSSKDNWPDGLDGAKIGQPILLHSYRHGLGEVTYNIVSGRSGGWKASRNDIEGVMDALMSLNQTADDLSSQVATNLGETYWPTVIEIHDPDHRDSTGGPPTPTKIKPGKPIALWKGEDLKPVFTPTSNPVLQWYFGVITTQMERLSGSSAIYGQQEPGVRTGYHASLQIAQSEHLDEMLEAHLTQGAIRRAHLMLKHIRATGEKTYLYQKLKEKDGSRTGRYLIIDPANLTPLPQLDATVRKPRPIDYSTMVRAAIELSQDRGGPGTPLLDDDTIRERILGEDAPDNIQDKIDIQNERRKLQASGVLSKLIAERLGMLLAQQSKPNVTADTAMQADPALINALGQMNSDGTVETEGGVSPALLSAQMAAGMRGNAAPPPPPGPGNVIPAGPVPGTPAPSAMNGRGGGLPAGAPQPEQAAGIAIMNQMRR